MNHCIDENAGGFVCALKNVSKQTSLEDVPLLPGIQVQIFQGSCFRNLLHLELFFHKANDEEARAWIARKQVIAWGIINELSVEIERLEAITVGDCDELSALKAILERTKAEHSATFERTVTQLKTEAEKSALEASEELASVKKEYESRIEKMESEHVEKITQVKQELTQTETNLTAMT